MQFSLFNPVGRRGRVAPGGSGGSSFGDTTVVNALRSRPFQLGVLTPATRAATRVVANLGYFHELARSRVTIGRLVRESRRGGSAFGAVVVAKFYTNFTAGFVLESPVGRCSRHERGSTGVTVYFSLGPIIR